MPRSQSSRTLRSRLIQLGQKLLEEQKGLFLLYPLGLCWRMVVFWKNFFYKKGFFVPRAVSKTVVSIGNVVAGGTGKTPLTALLAASFSHRKVAILSRGEGWQGSLADEPALLAQKCPFARVYAGKDRRALAKRAVRENAELILLDDGFQHRKLFRDFDLVLLSKEKPFSNGHFLPHGYLREDPKRLEKASLICVNPIDSEEELEGWQKQFSFSAPLVGVRLDVKKLSAEISLKGVPIALFCGIACPSSFRKTATKLGAFIVDEWILADHEGPKASDLKQFAIHAKSLGAKALFCTEKDKVKLPNEHFALPVIYPEMELTITAGRKHWENLVDKIERKIDNYKDYGKRSKNFTP